MVWIQQMCVKLAVLMCEGLLMEISRHQVSFAKNINQVKKAVAVLFPCV